MKRFVLTGPAERDLDQIKTYLVEKAGPRITRKVFQEIHDALKLSRQQSRNRPRPSHRVRRQNPGYFALAGTHSSLRCCFT
jgi:plasmid stabilization system protein ParE